MNKYFILMHKNDVVIPINFDVETGRIKDIGAVINPELIPLGGKLSKKEFNNWWERRAVPKTRKGIIAALNILNVDSCQSYLLQNLGLSLNDHYWVRPIDSELTWENVNLYENSFTDILGDFSFNGDEKIIKDIRGKTTFVPSASLQGELIKKWVIGENNIRYLLKGNYGTSCQQSLNEILATEMHKQQGRFPYTSYFLLKLSLENGENYGCGSSNFSNNKLEFIPAIDISSSEKKSNDISEFQFFINLCEKYGLSADYVSEFLQYQIESDFCVTNTDRHFNNFGVLRDTNTLKFVGMAPIYDTGNSMFWNVPIVTDNYKFLDISVSSFKKKEHQLLEYVTNKSIFNLDKLPNEDFIRTLYANDELMTDKRLESILKGYRLKQDILNLYQHGHNINHLAYECRNIPVSDKIQDLLYHHEEHDEI